MHTLPRLLFILACMTLAMYVTYNVYYPIYREFGGNQSCFVPFYACALYKCLLTLIVIILKEFLFNKPLKTPDKSFLVSLRMIVHDVLVELHICVFLLCYYF